MATDITFVDRETVVPTDWNQNVNDSVNFKAASTLSTLLLALWSSTSDAAKGVALQGYNPALAYASGLGAFLNLSYGRTAAEVTAGVTPTNYNYAVGDPRRYGAVVDGTTNDWTALNNANTVAKLAGVPLLIPPGTMRVVPTAVIDLGETMGTGLPTSIIKVDASAYSGVVFRVPGSSEVRDFTVNEDGLSGTATGLLVSAVDANEFTGHIRLTRLSVNGFAKNLDINNVFMLSVNQCQFGYGVEGVWCAPVDAPGDNGYVTTVRFSLCIFGFNTRNVYFNPALQSKCITFDTCSFEGATGAAEQAYFNKIRVLIFTSQYLEAAPTIPALRIADVAYGAINGGYMNGTGGIALGTNAELKIRNTQSVTSTDVLVATGGTEKVSLEGCDFPSSGNTPWFNFAQFVAVESTYNGVSYASFAGNHACGFTDDGYAASITPSLRFGNTLRYTVNNTSAFGFNAPLQAMPGSELAIVLKNTSGGVMATPTWNAVYKVPTLTLPATGFNRTFVFFYDGTNWVFKWQTAVDVPN